MRVVTVGWGGGKELEEQGNALRGWGGERGMEKGEGAARGFSVGGKLSAGGLDGRL